MADDDVKGGSSAGEDEGFAPVEPIFGEAAGSTDDSVDQVNPTSPINENGLDSVHSKPNDTRSVEDGVREDMFVDCPDEIEISESQQSSEEKDNLKVDHFDESDSGVNVQHLMAEIERLRDTHEKCVSEKERSEREYEEERAALSRELAHLCSQVKVLNGQRALPGESNDGFFDRSQNEARDVDTKPVELGVSLHDMISECSKLLDKALDERLRTEGEVRELLHTKSQEIDFLSAKVNELSESNQNCSQLYEAELEKHRYIEESVNRIIASLSMILNQEEFSNGSIFEKISIIEQSVVFLNENYNYYLSETEQLRRKEESLYQNLSRLEEENRKLIEQVEKQKTLLENSNSETGRLSTELEHEKNRYANSKEKLSMAVTKGKALVQQRDSLKQLLSEKTSQVDKCLLGLQEKEMILQKCEEIFSDSVTVEELQSADITEKLRFLADENKALKAISFQYGKLTDLFYNFDFPEKLASMELDSRVGWLVEEFHLSKQEFVKLKSEMFETMEAANGGIEQLTILLLGETLEKNYLQEEIVELRSKYEAQESLQREMTEANSEIDRLSKFLLAESQEKIDLQAELEDLRRKYEGVVENEYHLSLEKDKIVNMLLEASGFSIDGQDDIRDMASIVNNCLANIKEKSVQFESPQVDSEIVANFQSLLYVRDHEMTLYKLILEEDNSDRMEVNRLSDELKILTEELNTVNSEKATMQESLEQLEDRCGLLKEKLSMAVKKGKGLVQERENLKNALNEKNSGIDKLKSELQQNLSLYDESQNKITKLSLEVERISQLETDLIATKEHADQLERFLAESNNVLQRVMKSIENIPTPDDFAFEEPVEKVKWLAGFLTEHETAKTEVEQELQKVKAKASSLSHELSESRKLIKSLEDALSVSENNISEILDEKKELQFSNARLEEDLENEKDKVSQLTSKFEEVSMSKEDLEEALSLAEKKISHYMNERDVAEESRALAEEQLQKLKEGFSNHVSKLSDSESTIRFLEDALSQAEENVSLLNEENSRIQMGKDELEDEMRKIREEADLRARELADASLRIKSLEDELLNAENKLVDFVREKKNTEEEILSLRSQLAGVHGSMEDRSLELSGQLMNLKLLLEDETLFSLLEDCFRKKIEGLNHMDLVLKEMSECFLELDSDVPPNGPLMEDGSSISSTLPSAPDINLNEELLNDEMNSVDGENIISHLEKLNEKFRVKDKTLAAKVGNFSTRMDEAIAAQLRRLQITKDSLINIKNSMKFQAKDMEIIKQRQEETIASLERDVKTLMAACADASLDIESYVSKNMSELRSIQDTIVSDGRISMDLDGDDVQTAAGKLLLATRQNRDLGELFQETINNLMSRTEDLQKKLQENMLTFEEVTEERDMFKDRISKLETDLEEQKNLYQEMMLKLNDYREKEDRLIEREAELSTSLSKVQQSEDLLLSASEIKSVLDKISEIEVPDGAFADGDVRKLFYVIDSYNESLEKASSLSLEKEKLQSTIEKQIVEIEFLKSKVEEHLNNEKDLDKMKNEALELESGLENIVRKLGGNEFLDNRKVFGAITVLPLLDKLVMTIMVDCESLKSKNDELSAKLLGSQKVVDDLSNKVKLLEESNQVKIQARSVLPETIAERETSPASISTQSEISEVQDMAAVNSIPLVPSAAHVRTMRKGSSDHLAINIDSESERLVNNMESDEDKGRMFKSLNTTGLIPRQGRAVADRVDGFWVTGSRALMSHPRGRLGLIAYWLVLHIWLLGSIL